MSRFRFRAGLPLVFIALASLAGCHGSAAPTVTITVIPSTSISLDSLQPVNLSVTVGNDLNNQGVTWSLSTNTVCSPTKNDTALGDCGSLTNITATSVTYTAPQITTTAALSVSLVVTAKANTTVTQTVSISVVVPPSFTIAPLPNNQPTVLPNGSNGIPYSQTIAATGGVAPLSFVVTTGSLPAG